MDNVNNIKRINWIRFRRTSYARIVIPFDLIRNQMVIPVEMDGSTIKLIFDSGMPAIVGDHTKI